jgi:pimeloyl-ACP methyl ester carboxylesterase
MLDGSNIALRGVSFGSYFSLQMAAALGERCKGVVAAYVAHEPGLATLFRAASPTFKVRFMLMSGYEDETEFDRFSEDFDIMPWGPRIACPVMIQAGENDELSPLEHSEALFDRIKAPKTLVVYEGHKHVLRGAGAVAMGENPDTMFADWLVDRFCGKPAASERLFVTMSGQVRHSPA